MSKITSDNRYYILPWNHDELLEMLQQLDTKCLLTPEEYHILVNEKGIENLVTELDTSDISKRLEEIDTSKARKEDFEILLSKLNQLIRINEYQEDGNLELIDIRNGANGKTYLTAGDAIRNQFKDLNALVEPIRNSNVIQDEDIYKLKVNSQALLENYNNKVQEANVVFENNKAFIRDLNEQCIAQNIRLANIEKTNANQQVYLNALLDDSDMAKLGKVEYIMEYKSNGELINPNPKAGDGFIIIDNIKGLTLTNLSSSSSRFIIEENQIHKEDIIFKPNTEYIVKFKCETEDKTKTNVLFEMVKAADYELINTAFMVNNNQYNTFVFTSPESQQPCQIIFDCIEQVEIIDLLIMEYNPNLEHVNYFKGSYSTFEDFLNEDSGLYELTIGIRDFYNEQPVVSQLFIDLTTPLLEYDEIVYYGDIGFCHVHKTIIDEETSLPKRIEDETQVEVEVLNVLNEDSDKIGANSLYISETCDIAIYKRGTFVAAEDTAIFSIVPPEKVITYYDTTMYNAAVIASNITEVEDQNYELLAIDWDMNYRIYEIQWALEEAGLNQIEGDDFMQPMNFSVVEVAKKLIQAHKYIENIFIKQLDRFLLKGIISKKEYKELMNMMK